MDQSRGMLELAVALFIKIVTFVNNNSCMAAICIDTFSGNNKVFSSFFSKKIHCGVLEFWIIEPDYEECVVAVFFFPVKIFAL